jgi:hypothetical protein
MKTTIDELARWTRCEITYLRLGEIVLVQWPDGYASVKLCEGWTPYEAWSAIVKEINPEGAIDCTEGEINALLYLDLLLNPLDCA